MSVTPIDNATFEDAQHLDLTLSVSPTSRRILPYWALVTSIAVRIDDEENTAPQAIFDTTTTTEETLAVILPLNNDRTTACQSSPLRRAMVRSPSMAVA